MLEHNQQPQDPVLVKAQPKNRVEHFWLCGPCSAEMTLTYDRTDGMKVVSKPGKMLRARAS